MYCSAVAPLFALQTDFIPLWLSLRIFYCGVFWDEFWAQLCSVYGVCRVCRVYSVCRGTGGSILRAFTGIAPRPGGPRVPSWGWRQVCTIFILLWTTRFGIIGGCCGCAWLLLQGWYGTQPPLPPSTPHHREPFLSIIEEQWRRFVGTLLTCSAALLLCFALNCTTLHCSALHCCGKPSFPLRKRLGPFHS